VGLDTRTIELELCNDSGMDANGILLEFTFGRTEILRASVIEEKKVILNRPHTKAFQCGVVAAGAHTKLRLTYRMDPPAFRTSRSDPPLFFVTWLAPNGTPPPAAPDRFAPLPSPLRLNGPGDVAEIRRVARAHEPNVEQLRAKRDADIAATPGNPRVYKQFFADLDFQTNPRLGGASATAAVYMQLKRVLQDRFVRRASGPGVGSVPTPAAALLERELVRKVAMDVAAQLQGMIKNAFGPLLAFKAGNAPNFEEALEMFASGSLTSFDAHGAPDGPLMLALGEFALLLKELAGTPMPTHYQGKPIPAPAADIPDIDWAFWKQLLPVMCRVSEIFARCYHNPWPGHSYTMQAYTPNDNPNGRRGLDPYGTSGQADLAILQSIRTAWSSMDTAGEFARTIASALRNDPLVVTHGPHKVMPLIKPELAGRTWECANEVGSHERDQAMPEAEID
jgi:hypothetical protein